MIRFAATCAALLLAVTAPAAAAVISFTAELTGPNESPANNSPGIGSALVSWDDVANSMRVRVTFSGLTGNTTAAHIHGPTLDPFTGTAGVATSTPSFIGFPLGVTAGSMDQTYDMTLASSYRAAFISTYGSVDGARDALFAALDTGRAYFNIHTTAFPGGEIRGFFQEVSTPEPATLALLAPALLAVAARRRRAR